MCGNLRELSKDLALSSMQPFPEEYIKQTLLAHGFFKHGQNTGSSIVNRGSNCRRKDIVLLGISEEDKKKTTQLISLVKEGKEIHKLREPRNLYPHARQEPAQRKFPLWPIEVPCIHLQIKFIAAVPAKPEPFFRSEFDVVSPKIRSCDGRSAAAQVVYSNYRGPQKFFTGARAGPSPGLRTPSPSSPASTTLVFESRFESGNLAKAVQVGKWDYELYLGFDLYTTKHTQWFYFSVSNMRKGQTYRFTIVNLYKAGSLYNEGMQPVMYSVVGSKETGVGWTRSGHSIRYFKTPIKRADTLSKQEACYYGLTWSNKFDYDNDTCYFAHCYPYTYSDLQDYLHGFTSDTRKSKYVKVRTLCRTIAGNGVPVLTITSPCKSQTESKTKRAVVLTARVHPGETNGSWMMKGFLDFITGQSPDAKILRESFIFKVIPMLNPDGVIVGNYRCSLAGRDLNRNYRSKHKDSYPTILHAKGMVEKLAEEREIVLFCDFHGHSRKQNVFIYGCDSVGNPLVRLKSRVFPKMLSKNATDMFTYKGSSFGVHKSKEGTGRVVMWREMKVTNSYTMEATFCGSNLGKKAGVQFSTRDLELMGYYFCDTLLDYCDPDQTKAQLIFQDLKDEYRQVVLNKLATLGQKVPPGVDPLDLCVDLGSDENSSDMGSDSSESDGPPVHVIAKEARKKKKKKLKSRRERNKHKALLKLTQSSIKRVLQSTHTTMQEGHPQYVPDLLHNSRTQSMSNVHSTYRSSPTEVAARNGGIPMFTQERINEKQKRSLVDVKVSNDDSAYIEAVAMEYMMYGLSGEIIQKVAQHDQEVAQHDQEVAQHDQRKTLSSTNCLMSITSMAISENRPARTHSRASNRTSLPRLDDVQGAFASRYVANHLQDSVSGLHHSSESNDHHHIQTVKQVNSTKNLANLSRLFMQMKSQSPHHEPKHTDTKFKDTIGPNDNTNTPQGLDNHSRVEFQPLDEPVKVPDIGQSDSITQSLTKNGEHVQSRRELLHQQEIEKYLNNVLKKHKSNLSMHDKKVLAEIGSPSVHNGNLGKTSPPSNSLTSLTKPFESPERANKNAGDIDIPYEILLGKGDSVQPLKCETQFPEKKNLSEQGIDHDVLRKSLGLKHKKKSQSPPDHCPTVIPPLESNTRNTHDSNMPEARIKTRLSKCDPLSLPSSVKTSSSNKSTAVKNYTDTSDKVQKKKNKNGRYDPPQQQLEQLKDNHPTLQEVVDGKYKVPSGLAVYSTDDHAAINRTQEMFDGSTTTVHSRSIKSQSSSRPDKYVPILTNRMFSSKPPSRYGPRPTPETGVIPATVSLMLSGRVTSARPSTMCSIRRPPPALHVHYHMKSIRKAARHKKSQ